MSTIRLTPEHIHLIAAEAIRALPNECCGLLVGIGNPLDGIEVSEVVTSRNLAAADRPDRFEVDPVVRLETMRRFEGTEFHIVGHYHSHPDHPARPSETDLANGFEPDLAWLIAGVIKSDTGGLVEALAAYRLTPDGSAFEQLTAMPGSGNRFDLGLDD